MFVYKDKQGFFSRHIKGEEYTERTIKKQELWKSSSCAKHRKDRWHTGAKIEHG
jgi:hypothetical protein